MFRRRLSRRKMRKLLDTNFEQAIHVKRVDIADAILGGDPVMGDMTWGEVVEGFHENRKRNHRAFGWRLDDATATPRPRWRL